jgi:hypothetical protein
VRFQQALFASDLPETALEAVSANLSVLKSPTVMRLEDGTFYGFEGCHPAVVGFAPLQTQDGHFTCFWSLDPGWGQFVLHPGQASVRLLYGELRLRVLELPALAERAVQRVTLEGEDLPFTQSGGEIRFAAPVRMQRDQTLCVVA